MIKLRYVKRFLDTPELGRFQFTKKGLRMRSDIREIFDVPNRELADIPREDTLMFMAIMLYPDPPGYRSFAHFVNVTKVKDALTVLSLLGLPIGGSWVVVANVLE